MNGKTENQILGEYASQGFSLEECDGDHTIVLWFKDTMVAAFSQLGATRESIQDICKRHLEKLTTPVEAAQ